MATLSPPSTVIPRPKLAIKQSDLGINPLDSSNRFTTLGVLTTKEWIIPPRPKPGRKPATDTPPTKRKAQNRAAQRAFRERRAARVGELEEQLEEAKEEQQQRENNLKSRIQQLEADVERFSGELNSWKLRYDKLEQIAEYEKKAKEAALAELAFLRRDAQATDVNSVLSPEHVNHPTTLQQDRSQNSPESTACNGCTTIDDCACIEKVVAAVAPGCLGCVLEGPCACLEDFAEGMKDYSAPLESKRSHSPAVHEASGKRPRQAEPTSSLEIDFTGQFSSNTTRMEPTQDAGITEIELCGFCDEGSFCICAEAAAGATSSRDGGESHQLPQLLSKETPQSSEENVEPITFKLALNQRSSHQSTISPLKYRSCANGPGTCQQCQIDPRSGQFCRSLSALRGANSQIPEGCCGNPTSGSCCKSIPSAEPREPPPTLSCADAFKTLSNHRNFDRANNELNTWLGKLHATTPVYPDRAPMEVEAASVMEVLKLFDRRFGRDKEN
ncbi:hypothetical protein K3495_g2644 [Podosphaera aphanis]|nr:hypothetical protein K3495_g2644 [Podosphaera aphanis]